MSERLWSESQPSFGPSNYSAYMDLRTIKVARVFADDSTVMPNLYFCQPHAQNQGMLRAVISFEDCNQLVMSSPAIFLGDKFPNVCEPDGQARDFAVLGVSAAEANTQWPCGYYRVEADLMELNAQLLTLAP
jgi:hypothetical protein